jgi:hypothetical protein
VNGKLEADHTLKLFAAAVAPDADQRVVGSIQISGSSAPKLDSSPSLSDQLDTLLGTPIVTKAGLIASGASYQQFIQLVPTATTSADPDYSGILLKLMSDRGLMAERSQYTLGAVGSNPGQTLCANGEQYLAYNVVITTVPNVYIGTTKLIAKIAGQYTTCSGVSIPVSGDATSIIPTTKSSLLSYASILGLIIARWKGWTTTSGVISAGSGFADYDPTSTNTKAAVAEIALRNMTDNLCRLLPSPSPLQSTSPAASPTPVSSPAGPSGPGPSQPRGRPAQNPGGGAGGNGTTTPWDPGSIPGLSHPYEPQCHSPLAVDSDATSAVSSGRESSVDNITDFSRRVLSSNSDNR